MNEQVLEDNFFIDKDKIHLEKSETTRLALEAHNRYMLNLKEAGIDVEVFDQPVEAPDSIFPDWFITA